MNMRPASNAAHADRSETRPHAAVRHLSKVSSAPRLFWRELAETARGVARAKEVLLFARTLSDDGPGPWQTVAFSPPTVTALDLDALAPRYLQQHALGDGMAVSGAGQGVAGRDDDILLCACALGSEQQDLLMCIRGAQAAQGDGPALLTRIGALASAPLAYDAHRSAARSSRDAARLAQVLELVGKVSDTDTFDRAGLAWVNGLAEQFACDSVSLVWRAREGMRLRAISHAERVERRTEASALAEQVAHEALAQGSEILFPQPDATASHTVVHSHGQYAALVHPGHMITVPMIEIDVDGREVPLGAVLLERQRSGFSAAEQWAVRLHCELAQPALQRLFQESYWLPRRLARAIAPSIPRALRPRSVSGRGLLFAGLAGLIALAAIPIPFRLTATAVLKTDAIAYVSAPYDGFLESSATILGTVVAPVTPLFALDRTDLVLERDALLAELAGSNREAEIQRAAGALSEMQIALARSEQVTTQLMQLDLQIAAAEATSPIAGIVVEGEPAKMLGEPVRRGDPIVTVAALDGLYVEAALSERDLAFLASGQMASLSLLARPNDRVEMEVDRIIPAAAVQDGDNVFPVRMADLEGAVPEWWLPGMTGVAKISVGSKPLGWVVTRRLVDYLRLALWL